MRRAPAFTAVAVLSLALGIGANTAIFSLINTLTLRLLPVREPGRLVELVHQFPHDPRLNSADLAAYEYLRDNNTVLSGLLACSQPDPSRASLSGEDAEPESVDAQYVDGSFFQVLGVEPLIGRLLGPKDDTEGAEPAAVVSWSYWNRRFHRDPGVVGRRITLQNLAVTIVGVTPPEFFGVALGDDPQIWLTLAADSTLDGAARQRRGVALMGRLKPGVSIEQAQAELATLYRQTFDQARLKTDFYLRNLKFELEPARASPLMLFGNSLVVSQVAVSVLLLSAAGVFLEHLSGLRNGVGFQRDHLLLVRLDASGSAYSVGELTRGYRELLERMQSIPGVRSASISGMTPISGAGAARHVSLEGQAEDPTERPYCLLNWIGPGYFETLGTPLLAGRDFTFQDLGSAHLAIINQTMAHSYFGEDNPIGRRFHIEGDANPYEVIGVAADAKYTDPGEVPQSTIYFPAFEEARMVARHFLLRTDVPPAAVTGEVRRAVSDVLKTVSVDRVTTMAEQVDASIVPERLIAMLSSVFGALGSLLAAIGLYGLLAYTVARRINEIGIRMALGATPTDATWMILRDALKMVACGLLIGLPIVFWCKRFAATVIEGLPLESPLPIVFAAAAMVAVALLASSLPAHRAASVDPMKALRHD